MRRGQRELISTERVPAGGLFLHPADTALNVELGGPLNTVHAYLTDEALQEAGGGTRPVRLEEEFGGTDPLLEQLLLALDRVVRDRSPATGHMPTSWVWRSPRSWPGATARAAANPRNRRVRPG